MSNFLTHNPFLLGTTAAVLALAALLACLLPARKATLLNPVQALRADYSVEAPVPGA